MSEAPRRKPKAVRRDGCEALIVDEKEGQALHIICPVCVKLLRDPVQAECGDRFCLYCIEKLVSSDDKTCPRCKATVHQDRFFKDVFAAKELSSVKVYCSSKRHAAHDLDWCLWSGILADFPEHEELCEYARVECTECLALIKRLDLVAHKLQTCTFRKAKCRLCSAELAWNETKTHEDTDCPEALVSCPNGCSVQPLPRKTVEQHRKTCSMQTVNCYYNNSGCEYKGQRMDLRTHHDSSLQYHLQLVDRCSHEAKTRATEASRAAAKIGKLDQTTQGCVTAIDQQQGIIQTLSARLEAREASDEGMKQQIASLQASLTELAIRVRNTEERQASNALVLGDGSTPSVLAQVDENSSRLARMDRTVALHDLQLSDQSMRQDILEVRSQTGTMVWKISELERRKREAATGKTPSLYSPPFYTSACGYKMCLRLYLNGDGAGHGTHLSLFFAIMRGDFDGLLKWPFQQKVTLMLLNQAPIGAEAASGHIVETFKPDITSSSFHRPDSDMNVATGCPTFAPLSMLQIGSRFVRDDSLFVKVCVDLTRVPVPDAHLGTGRLL